MIDFQGDEEMRNDEGVFIEDGEIAGLGITAYDRVVACALCQQPEEEYADHESAIPGGYVIGWIAGGLSVCRTCALRLRELLDAVDTQYSVERP